MPPRKSDTVKPLFCNVRPVGRPQKLQRATETQERTVLRKYFLFHLSTSPKTPYLPDTVTPSPVELSWLDLVLRRSTFVSVYFRLSATACCASAFGNGSSSKLFLVSMSPLWGPKTYDFLLRPPLVFFGSTSCSAFFFARKPSQSFSISPASRALVKAHPISASLTPGM
jgi:hypothetical protein